MNMLNIKKTLGTAVFALSSIAATAIIPTTSVIGTSVAVTGLMAISSPAQAAQCKGVFIGRGSANAVFNKAGIRRAKRRAIRNWESQAKKKFGREFDNFNDARNVRFFNCEAVKGSGGQSGFQRCSVRATACN